MPRVWRDGGLMVVAPDSESSILGVSHCLGTCEFNAGEGVNMQWTSILSREEYVA